MTNLKDSSKKSGEKKERKDKKISQCSNSNTVIKRTENEGKKITK
jgi:hypothetical protein